ncbi:alpha/beta hydrolase [Nostoc flagelliforme FACHB-838]|uniref:Alpha/beta hydrolase n=1 Tax=Nostoc flagelliforme FACHB-838 TaxID=2692904 RepID=A0ABR8DYS2_9NOSO|nr:alpha/beta hydrolase [Nostoc flagelliforme]MBD2534579.1 alpha/beta hydrolase [Nostoc flagelliforme FACHB-838]
MLSNDVKQALDLFFTPGRKTITKDEQDLLDSAKALKIPYGEIELAAYSWGTGPVVVLVHGWGQRGINLGAFIAPLVQHGFCVITFDGPAHGESPGAQTHVVDFGQAVRAVIKYMEPVYGIISHSFGAASTMMMLAWEPDVTVEKLVLIGTPSDLVDVIGRFAVFTRLSEQVVQKMHQWVEFRDGKPIEAFSVRAVAPFVKIPTLVIHDRRDREIPFSDAQAITAGWSQATLIATEGLGHRRILRDTSVVEQIMGFLNGSNVPSIRMSTQTAK